MDPWKSLPNGVLFQLVWVNVVKKYDTRNFRKQRMFIIALK